MNRKYLWYVLRHKWFVFLECLKIGLPIWVGLTHDLSKFSLWEWDAYARWLDGGYLEDKQTGKSNAPPDLKASFEQAWNHHIHANPHHWQYWILNNQALEMPERYLREMIADWRGVGYSLKGIDDSREFYLKKRNEIILHPNTRLLVERELGIK